MKAWRVSESGHYGEALEWGEHPEPACPDTGVVIEVAAAGINFPDLLAIAGLYQVKAPLPFVPGLEAVGEVVKAGPKSRFAAGQRVIANANWGAYGEWMAAPDIGVFAIPPAMPDDHAAAFLIAYQTSFFAFVHRARLAAGEVALIHGGAGGVGTSAIQIAKRLGARVIATASTADKLAHCEAMGADHAINYKDEDFVAEVKRLTGGYGADVVYDPVGGDVTVRSTKCIAWNGRVIIIGFASGSIPEIPANRILLKNISIVGLHWGAYFVNQPELVRKAHEELLIWYQNESIQPHIGGAYDFADLPKALAAVEKREAIGKLVVSR
jgi:NADPH2:quinone reductase